MHRLHKSLLILSTFVLLMAPSAYCQTQYGGSISAIAPIGNLADRQGGGFGLDGWYRWEIMEKLALGAGFGYHILPSFGYLTGYLTGEYMITSLEFGEFHFKPYVGGNGGLFVSGATPVGVTIVPKVGGLVTFRGVGLFGDIRTHIGIPGGNSYLSVNVGVLLL